MSGHGVRVWLVRQGAETSGTVARESGTEYIVPGVADSEFKLSVPPLQSSFVFQKLNRQGSGDSHEGRVKEMLYHDLIPGRQGGRFIASRITVSKEEPLNDAVHFHRIRFIGPDAPVIYTM